METQHTRVVTPATSYPREICSYATVAQEEKTGLFAYHNSTKDLLLLCFVYRPNRNASDLCKTTMEPWLVRLRPGRDKAELEG